MAQLTERELRDKQRGLESLNARDAKDMDLQRKQMNIWRDDTRPSAIQRYNTAKAKLDELNAAVNTRIAEIELIKSQLSDIADNKESEKTTQDIKTKNKQLKIAEENLETTKAEQLRAEIKALEDKAKVSLTGGSTGNEQYDGDNDFVRDVKAKGLSVTVDPNNGNSWVSGAEGDSQVQQYIYISEESRPTEIVGGKLRRSGSSSKPYTPSTSDFDAIRKRIIEEAISSPRGLKGLFDDLRGAGLRIPNNDYNRLDTTSVSFGQALSSALQRHTKAMVNDLEINKNTNPKSFFQYVREDLKDSGIGDPEVDYNEYVTKRDEADSDLNRFFQIICSMDFRIRSLSTLI